MTDYGDVNLLNGTVGATVKELAGVDLVGFKQFEKRANDLATDPNTLSTCVAQSVAMSDASKGLQPLVQFDKIFGEKIKTDFDKELVSKFNNNRDIVRTGFAHGKENNIFCRNSDKILQEKSV